MKRLLYIVCLFFTFEVSAQELRIAGECDYKINKKQNFCFSLEWRNKLEEEVSNYSFFRVDYSRKLNKHFKVKLTNRFSFENNKLENTQLRSTVDMIYKPHLSLDDGEISNRLRFQQKIKDWNETTYQLRERIKFSYDLNKYVTPYVSAELLYTFHCEDNYQSRVSLGSCFEIGEVTLELYYKSEMIPAYRTVLFNHIFGSVWKF